MQFLSLAVITSILTIKEEEEEIEEYDAWRKQERKEKLSVIRKSNLVDYQQLLIKDKDSKYNKIEVKNKGDLQKITEEYRRLTSKVPDNDISKIYEYKSNGITYLHWK
jgi:hypothetical protein